MNEALWGFSGVIIGALASSATTLGIAWWTMKNERADAAAERYRAALYGLQDELTGLTKAVSALLFAPDNAISGIESLLQLDRMERFASRSGDQELYDSYRAIRVAWFEGPDPVTSTLAWRESMEALYLGPVSDMNNRIRVLLHAPNERKPIEVGIPPRISKTES
jgi:hypothetical protein